MSLSISNIKKYNSDYKEKKELLIATKKACKLAVRKSKKMGLTITFLENDTVYKELPNGQKIKVKKINKSLKLIGKIDIRKGTILNAKI